MALESFMSNKSVEHMPLVVEPSTQDLEEATYEMYHPIARQQPRVMTREKWLFFVIVLQAMALLGVILMSKNKEVASCQGRPQGLLYSPAQSIVEYEVKSFTPGREHKTIYQGLSDETDRAWEDLYNHAIMKIPRSEAVLLPNKTYPIHGEPGYYLGALDVFHQLHCLNNVRRALHRDRYKDDKDDLHEEHVSHCVDTIRQSLMCNADISVNVWQWSAELSAVVGYSTQAHTCRNFDKLRDWARSRRLHDWIDTRLFVEDDLPDPPITS